MAQELIHIWWAGVAAVRGDSAVRAALSGASGASGVPGLSGATGVSGASEVSGTPSHILAVGKAACDMARPAMEAYPDAPTLIVTKHGHGADLPRAAEVIEAGHPIPDTASLLGGAALARAVAQCGAQDRLLLLVSGGASAVAELLPDGMTLADLQAETTAMMASGADIHAMNTRRRQISQIKGGKLLARFGGASVTVLAISDVEGDGIGVIGSGIGDVSDAPAFAYDARIVASNAIARAAAGMAAQQAADGAVLANEECLYDDVTALAPRLGARLRDGAPGLYIFGGEPVVQLPDNPGRGGRNQALALMMAQQIAGRAGIEILVAGTDGSDGPTGDAGALVDGATWGDGAAEALARADAGSYLAAKGALVTTGPTGTNVMDLMIARIS